jgi:uroporphyrin-III C-methyltransferase/precorrin-2 dehydrogenase/sirohydrochlorin ferrochelatase
VSKGLDPTTPAVAVARATRPDQQVIAGTIADLPQRLDAEPLGGPLIVMIGRVFAPQMEDAAVKPQAYARSATSGSRRR